MTEIYKNQQLADLLGEVWKDVLGYEGLYQCSNLGRIKSLLGKSPKILKQWPGGSCALMVTLCADGNKNKQFVSNIIGGNFIGFPDRSKNEVYIHLNKIQSDNRVVNLSIETRSVSHLLNYHLGVQKDWGIKNVGAKTQFVKNTIYIGKNKDGSVEEFTSQELHNKYGTGVRSIMRVIEKRENFNTAYGKVWDKRRI